MDRPSISKERRDYRRVPVSIEVVVYYNTLMLPECRIRDLTPESAFIVTGGHFLPDRAQLDLAISVPGQMPQRFAAQVMRSNEEGVGVRLHDGSPASMRRLIETLYTAEATAD
jgi:hypothetical protein